MARQLLSGTGETFEVREVDLDLDDADAETVYTLRALTMEDDRRILEKHSHRTRKQGTVIDETAVLEDMLAHVLVGWDGVLIGGEPAPCDVAHHRLLPTPVVTALIQRARMGQRTGDAAAESFRQSARVL